MNLLLVFLGSTFVFFLNSDDAFVVICSQQTSLPAVRAETMVDGLPRAFTLKTWNDEETRCEAQGRLLTSRFCTPLAVGALIDSNSMVILITICGVAQLNATR